jgi:hypothetical protein
MQASLDQFYDNLHKSDTSSELKEEMKETSEHFKPIFTMHEEYQIWLCKSKLNLPYLIQFNDVSLQCHLNIFAIYMGHL